jgi:hypothetical protein
MLASVHSRLLYDVSNVYTALTGKVLESRRVGLVVDAYYDIGDGTGNLIQLAFKAQEEGSFADLAMCAAQMACPFHCSKALFDHAWHGQFDMTVECMRRDLGFLYDRSELLHLGTATDIAIQLERAMIGPIHTFVEAFRYGNGVPLLRSKGKIDEWYNRAGNYILSFWLAMDQSSKSLSGTEVTVM